MKIFKGLPEGYYGEYGGRYVPELLIPVLDELRDCFNSVKNDKAFFNEYYSLLKEFCGRETPLTYAKNLTEYFGKGRIFIKREDLNHSGAHKINNVMGQALIMKKLGKTRVIAETGAGQHGVATAVMAAKMGFDATIYMGAEDVARQYPNVFWMRNLGAKVVAVEDGTATLKDAINESMRDWASNFEDTHYCLGTTCGPHPFPEMVTYFQSVISKEIKKQLKERENKLPDRVYACLGGGSNSMGAFYEFLDDESVKLIGVEAGGKGEGSGMHASRIAYKTGKTGVAQGYKTIFLQNEEGQMMDTWSISAGLDYIGVSPISAYLSDIGRVNVEAATDEEVIEAFKLVSRKEGIIPALESSHAFAAMIRDIEKTGKDEIIVVNMSGRGDKDIFNIGEALGDADWMKFVKERGDSYER
ncbi:tryptophan synthase beta chain [Dethiosulfatibacter aminovorans DSM 17477]|uniref:Tryptophan synthase beta chain n=1 Tax=Dethiosulfatibacter aminovorans DSM 17477 TaxID=1121476 RepID=A0A1M6J948_9FIRM|nr:tryptophan synthase subunit beta [Dethiosulfatibacter aminovorans]SHJ43256.1 tryptophan synthase beta chain [Dethiosulfatibacter aminovorans DSM 17477]